MNSVKSYKVELCKRSEVKDFIETWHYSKNINGLISDYCFKLLDNNKIIGACIFGRIAMANVWKKYAEKETDLTELRRLCCIDDTPKNTESYFIASCLRYLKKHTSLKKIISYADLTYGHTGVIYQASNFEFKGQTQKGKVIMYQGKRYHDKAIRTKYKGQLKPFAIAIKNALQDGSAYYVATKGKNIYIYKLNNR